MKRRGRPVMGGIFGLLFGVFLALDLSMAHISALDTVTVIGLPVLGLVLGIVLAFWAPFGSKKVTSPPPSTSEI